MIEIQKRRLWLLLPLFVVAALAYAGAFLLRFEFFVPAAASRPFFWGLAVFLPVKAAAFWLFRLHTMRWRQVALSDLMRIVLANFTGSTIACVVTSAVVGPAFPRSIFVIDGVLCLLGTAGAVLSVRLLREAWAGAVKRSARDILIYGAGETGLALAREFRMSPKLATRVAGFLDDDAAKQGECVQGIPVLGGGRDAARLADGLARAGRPISEIVIAMPSATPRQRRTVVEYCRAAGIPSRTVPGLSELLSGKVVPQIRNVTANDLLGRDPVRIEEDRIAERLTGQTVLVTGGCGSIGSELCRQVARFRPARLVILDQAESEMFMLALDLRQKYPDLNLVTELGDIARLSRVEEVFARHPITAVFHAAAYKHVPLMEEHIVEAVENNILGTYNVASTAHWSGVKQFVLISSDKAVNPTSIMGVTKRISELIVSGLPLDGGSKNGAFVSVRFGNVLGSAGSVIPVFQRQIAHGGPVTVTHPEMRRYFMSVSEAVELVLQASTMGEDSEVFVLDMGEPVRIMELAQNMIRLAGLVPGEDIEVRVTGLRPGEKLYEELRLDGEDILPTQHEKVKRFRSARPRPAQLGCWLDDLRVHLRERDETALVSHLLALVPEYQGAHVVVPMSPIHS